jgi:membrane protease YdiL (CAAX protease family)
VIPFQRNALILTALWLEIVAVRFRRSTFVLVGGLFTIALYAAVTFSRGEVSPKMLGLGVSGSWLPTIVIAIIWSALMFAFSPLADKLAGRWFREPPNLKTFRALQESPAKLLAGIAIAWLLGAFLEELVFRGIVLQSLASFLNAWFSSGIAVGAAVCLAAAGAGIIHLYQGPKATVIVTQLSVLFGVLFVLSGRNLWAVMLCHGFYDTIAFIRFGLRKSKYSKLESDATLPTETEA